MTEFIVCPRCRGGGCIGCNGLRIAPIRLKVATVRGLSITPCTTANPRDIACPGVNMGGLGERKPLPSRLMRNVFLGKVGRR